MKNVKQKNEWEIHNMEIKQHTSKQPVGQRRNQKGNSKILWEIWKYNIPKIMTWTKIEGILL